MVPNIRFINQFYDNEKFIDAWIDKASKFDLNLYDGALKWNGRDMNGVLVDNGVYFIRMKYASSVNKSPQYFWDKLIVVK